MVKKFKKHNVTQTVHYFIRACFFEIYFFPIATDFCLFTQECQFQEKKWAIFWWTNIFGEKAQKVGKSGY